MSVRAISNPGFRWKFALKNCKKFAKPQAPPVMFQKQFSIPLYKIQKVQLKSLKNVFICHRNLASPEHITRLAPPLAAARVRMVLSPELQVMAFSIYGLATLYILELKYQ